MSTGTMMIDGTCAECRWWKRNDGGRPGSALASAIASGEAQALESLQFGECNYSLNNDSLMYAPAYAYFHDPVHTHENFACCAFGVREKK